MVLKLCHKTRICTAWKFRSWSSLLDCETPWSSAWATAVDSRVLSINTKLDQVPSIGRSSNHFSTELWIQTAPRHNLALACIINFICHHLPMQTTSKETGSPVLQLHGSVFFRQSKWAWKCILTPCPKPGRVVVLRTPGFQHCKTLTRAHWTFREL